MKRFRITLEADDYMAGDTASGTNDEVVQPYLVEEIKEHFEVGMGIQEISGLRISKSEVVEIKEDE